MDPNADLIVKAVNINFLLMIEKLGNPSGAEWRNRTSAQNQRFQAMHVITHAEFAEYKKWVELYQECSCGTHLGFKLPEDLMVRTMVLGFLDDRRIAIDEEIEFVPYGFSPGEQPLFADLDEELAGKK